jgi:hypothetical protein
MRVTVRELRKLIGEEIERDPFPAKKRVTVMDAGEIVTRAEDVLEELIAAFDAVASQNTNRNVRASMKKAAGLARHASDDVVASQTLCEVALEDMLHR